MLMSNDSADQNVTDWLDAHPVINASGTMTALGGSSVSESVAEAVRHALPRFVDIAALQAFASSKIAKATGAEAGCVTSSAASGITVSVAACLTGVDTALIEELPDTTHVPTTNLIVQKSHQVNFGASISQVVRLAGANLTEIGTSTACRPYQLEGALSHGAACALYVVSHHTVQAGMIGLKDFVRMCHQHDVPVIVDAASEYDLKTFLQQGADLVVYSAHKFLGGPTAGIIAGTRELVRACYINQTIGIGRVMKVGKEGIVGAVAALDRWTTLDHQALHAEEYAKAAAIRQGIQDLPGISVTEIPDPTGNPITRLKVVTGTHERAKELARLMLQGDPPIVVRGHDVDLGYFELDPCNLMPGDVEAIVERFRAILGGGGDEMLSASEASGPYGPRHSRYLESGLPAVDLASTPWGNEADAGAEAASSLLRWPDDRRQG